MRSVIDEIASAEKQAEEIRQNAASEAREMIVHAREEAIRALTVLENEERETTQTEIEAARQEGEKLSAEMIQKLALEADELCARANTRLDKAISYLVNKVTKPA